MRNAFHPVLKVFVPCRQLSRHLPSQTPVHMDSRSYDKVPTRT